MEERLVTINTYSKMINRSKERVRQKIHTGEIPSKIIDGVIFVVLTDEEMQECKSLFSQHPTKGLQRIGDVMNAMFNGKAEE